MQVLVGSCFVALRVARFGGLGLGVHSTLPLLIFKHLMGRTCTTPGTLEDKYCGSDEVAFWI